MHALAGYKIVISAVKLLPKLYPFITIDICTPYNVGSVLQRLLSTAEAIQYCGGSISTVEAVQYCGGIASVLWRLFSTVGDSISTAEG